MNPIARASDTVPFVGFGVVILAAGFWLTSVAAGFGCVLQIFQIESALNSVLPSWNGWHYAIAAVVSWLAARGLVTFCLPSDQIALNQASSETAMLKRQLLKARQDI